MLGRVLQYIECFHLKTWGSAGTIQNVAIFAQPKSVASICFSLKAASETFWKLHVLPTTKYQYGCSEGHLLGIISQLLSVDNDEDNIFEANRYFDGFVRFETTAV